jgi:hypothetical protein
MARGGLVLDSALSVDPNRLKTIAMYAIEETLAMLGIVLFLYALLSHLAEETGGLVLRFK